MFQTLPCRVGNRRSVPEFFAALIRQGLSGSAPNILANPARTPASPPWRLAESPPVGPTRAALDPTPLKSAPRLGDDGPLRERDRKEQHGLGRDFYQCGFHVSFSFS
jgi:hypothetical protein